MNRRETLERALRLLPTYEKHSFGDKANKIDVSEIIELLKIQEPRSVTEKDANGTCGVCPRCGIPNVRWYDRYCSHCGQAVKW